jgi:hypothetical protein
MLGGSSCCGSATTGGATKTKNRVVKPKKKVVKKIKGGNTETEPVPGTVNEPGPEPGTVSGPEPGNVSGGAKKTKKRVVKPKKIVKKYGNRKGGYTEKEKETDTDTEEDGEEDGEKDGEEDGEQNGEQNGDQGGGAKKKKGSKVVKRALTPYNKFVKKNFAIMKKKFPNQKAPQIMQKVAIEWKIFKNK